MPDNVEITAGSGTPIKTDLVGTAHYQVVKLDAGGDGLAVPVVAGQQAMAASLPVVLASDQTPVLVGASDTVVTVTPTCDTSAYSSGDLLFDSTEIAGAVRANGYCAVLQSVTLLDKDDQKMALTLLFADASTDFGTLNSAPDPDDTECATVLGAIEIAAADYVDLGGASVATIKNIGLLLKAGASTTSLYVAAINGTSAPTHTASGLVLKVGLLRS